MKIDRAGYPFIAGALLPAAALALTRRRGLAAALGLLGGFFAYAAFKPGLQPLAFIAGFISVISFLWLAWSSDGYNSLLGKIATADVIALVCLIVGSGVFVTTK